MTCLEFLFHFQSVSVSSSNHVSSNDAGHTIVCLLLFYDFAKTSLTFMMEMRSFGWGFCLSLEV